MVTAEAFIPIEEKHGDDCTCKPVGHIAIDLVAASRLCPGDRNPHRGGTITSQLQRFEPTPYPGIGIDITWPAPTGNGTPLTPLKMLIHDHVTGQPLLGITGLRIALGGDQWDTDVIQVDIKTCVDIDGQPLIGAPANVVRDPEDPEQVYSKVFRCYVIEMRLPPIDPSIPTRESVARGAHTIDEYRKHHGLHQLHDIGAPLLPPHDLDADHHSYPVRKPLSLPHEYEPCSCGRRLGETAEEARARLAADTPTP